MAPEQNIQTEELSRRFKEIMGQQAEEVSRKGDLRDEKANLTSMEAFLTGAIRIDSNIIFGFCLPGYGAKPHRFFFWSKGVKSAFDLYSPR
jgi:hypothetical protein